MKRFAHLVNRRYAGCAVGLVTSAWCAIALPIQAQVSFVPTPPDQGAPDGRQRGGANRGDCLSYQGLTALVPEVDGKVWSQTVSTMPHFLFKIPAPLNESISLELVVQDSSDNYVFRKQFSIDAAAGTLSIPTSGLTTNANYSWTFSIYCDAARPSESVSVSGTVQRVADLPEMTTVIAALSPEEKINRLQQYAAEGIWHEAISLALGLYQAEQNNATYTETLESLFEQAKLADISLPIVVYDIP